MTLGWNEIRARAAKFSTDWKDAHYEKGESQTFYNEFFEVFGNRRRNVAVYEEKVKKLNNKYGYIDLFWPGTLLVEQKSADRDLKKAREQATDYFISLKEKEKPRFILLSDFQNFELLDLEENEEFHFRLDQLSENVRHFAFIAGYQIQYFRDQHPANIEASELMSDLHKHLEESGYAGHDLERLLVRIMFCLFAEDTGIFTKESFLRYVEDRTQEDGSDLGSYLVHLFQILNTQPEKRQKNLDEDLADFPYVNGELFKDPIQIPSFDTDMRDALLECCYFDWTKISPALFGSLFQTVMLPDEQRHGGAHYTSERNILKVVNQLFLDDLRGEFKKLKKDRSTQKKARLEKFHEKIASLTIFDPACGCGNFLILAFRELRELELEILSELYPEQNRQTVFNIELLTKIRVDQFFGIEIEEFPARIAESAMWLVDHQMNMKLSNLFGLAFVRLPLTTSAQIFNGNALTTDWDEVLPSNECNYILGNPPFVGKHLMDRGQSEEIRNIFNGINGAGVLDYVTGWYLKAAQYIQNTVIRCSFVSTNSITQGEQVSVLWGTLLENFNIKINFAHRTFKWTIDEERAQGMHIAAVFVVIIGFAAHDTGKKYIYEYETLTSNPHKLKAKNINPYLIEGDDIVVKKRSTPICETPEIKYGSKPVDDGNYFFTDEERKEFLKIEPNAKKYIRSVVSAREYMNNVPRWCLWLKDANPADLRSMPPVLERIRSVKKFRLASKKEQTRAAAQRAQEFAEIRQPDSNYIVVPLHTSENREYVPFGFFSKKWILHNSCACIPNSTPYEFGVISSSMHMAWLRIVCGRIKGDYRYSNTLVYNNFPWPKPSKKQKEQIITKAEAVLDARKQFPDNSFADLYDPNTMPPVLIKAHRALDKAVDKAYSKAVFKTENQRISYLFDLYVKKRN